MISEIAHVPLIAAVPLPAILTPAETPTLTVTVPAASTAVIARVAPYAGSVALGYV